MSKGAESHLPRPKKTYEVPGMAGRIHQLWDTRYVFMANHQEFVRTAEVLRDPLVAARMFADHRQLQQFQLEVVRLLHNYLASAMTLVAHTRILAEDLYRDTDFWVEYQDRTRETFAESPLAQFVQRLRNYMLHVALPFTSATMNLMTGPDFDCYVNLNLNTLREWDDWTVLARQYLDECPGEYLRLDEVVRDYTAKVEDFSAWFGARQRELHFP